MPSSSSSKSSRTSMKTTRSSLGSVLPLRSSTSYQAFDRRRATSAAELAEMRRLFEEAVAATPAAYHPVDVQRVRTDDWQLLRFLERSPRPEEAFAKLNATLLWKMSVGVHEKRDEDFPQEFYKLNGIEVVGRHPESGHLVLWVTSKYSRDFTDIKPYIKDFMIHETERMDVLAGASGLLVIADSKHVGLFSVDLELTRFLQDIVSLYYPGSIRLTLIINLSFYLDPIYRIVMAFLDAELRATMKLVALKDLSKFLPVAFIPVEYSGGQRKTKVLRLPEAAPRFMQCDNIQLSEAQKNRAMVIFKRLEVE